MAAPPMYGGGFYPTQPMVQSMAQPLTPSVSVVPFVVPALTPAASSAAAVIKPSHQVLIVRPLPAFLTEDEDLLALAKQFVVSTTAAGQEAVETLRILKDGDEAVMARIRQINTNVAKLVATAVSTPQQQAASSSSASAPAQHCNYLPFAAKVIRKSVLSAVTASLQRQQQQKINSTAPLTAAELVESVHAAICESDVMPASKCFCEEGYGFLLFATEEAGLTYLRAAEKLANAQLVDRSVADGLGLRPSNVTAVRRDFDEIEQIKRRLYEGDDEEDVLNASFSSSLSSSSCDSATSFDSQSSFESIASDDDCEETTTAPTGPSENLLHIDQQSAEFHDCDQCTGHRRLYRTYYRAQMNRRIDSVKLRCGVIVDPSPSSNKVGEHARRPVTFNGVPAPSKEHVAEMRSLFANCFFNTVLSVAGADATVSAKPKPKAALLMAAAAAAKDDAPQAVSEQQHSSVAEPSTTIEVMVHRPVLINCTDAARPTVSFMRASTSAADTAPTSVVMSVVSENLSRFATALAATQPATKVDTERIALSNKRHHTHHRHCEEHRPAAASRRIERRRVKVIQSKMQSRAMQAPHVVNISIPVNTYMPTPSSACQPLRIPVCPPAYKPSAMPTESVTTAQTHAPTEPLTVPAQGSAAPLVAIDDFAADNSDVVCPSPFASTTNMHPTHSATNSFDDTYNASSTTPAKADRASSPAVTNTAASSLTNAPQRRFRHNPYGSPAMCSTPASVQPVDVSADQSSYVAEVAPPAVIVSSATMATLSSVSRAPQPQQNQNQHNHNQGSGLAAFLPSWAQNGGTGLQGAANNASAKLRNMLSMSKVKRF
eukprot:GILK01014478.1.p1 GENE.GILK01014478.1~~GILK01014478.1.p1  ORF type:complete len:865 (-),score=82.37 GILK01014478.1:30-2519(-)